MQMGLFAALKATLRWAIRNIAVKLNKATNGEVTPDMITAAGLLLHLPVAYLIWQNMLVAAALLLIIFSLFDVLDGELARLQNKASVRGMIADAVADRIKEIIIFASIAGWMASTGRLNWIWAVVLACGASLLVSYVKAKGEAALALKKNTKDHHKLNRHFAEGFMPYEVRVIVVVIGLLSSQLILAMLIIALGSIVTAAMRLKAVNEQL